MVTSMNLNTVYHRSYKRHIKSNNPKVNEKYRSQNLGLLTRGTTTHRFFKRNINGKLIYRKSFEEPILIV